MDTADYPERLAGICIQSIQTRKPHSKRNSTSTVTPVRNANITKGSCLLLWSFCQSLFANAGRISQIGPWPFSTKLFPCYCPWSSSVLIQVAVPSKA